MARFDNIGEQFFDDSGNPLNGGKLLFEESGTSTLKTTFSDIDETIPNTNPVILSADGRPGDIYFTGSARVTLYDRNDVIIDGPRDPITASGSAGGRLAFSAWNAVSTYSLNDIVTYNGKYYRCMVATSQGDTPDPTLITPWAEVNFIQAAQIAKFSKGADVASATNLTLGADGNYFDITGATTIATIGAIWVGTVVKLHFDGILTLTHSADLVLPSGANITTAAGDEAEFVEYATGDWRCTSYTRADGTSVVSSPGGAFIFLSAASASGSSSVDITIPSGYDEYVIRFLNVIPSADGTTLVMRTSADGGSTFDSGATDYSYGYYVFTTSAAPQASTGAAFLYLSNAVGNAANEQGASGAITIEQPSLAQYTCVRNTCDFMSSTTDTVYTFAGMGVRKSAAIVNAIRIFYSSGNVSSGLFALYGVKRS